MHTLSTYYVGSLTGAQNYFHQLAGLTTKPDVFPMAAGTRRSTCPRPTMFCSWETPRMARRLQSKLMKNAGLQASVTDPTANYHYHDHP